MQKLKQKALNSIEMKQMPDRVFIDSNILIYAYSVDEPSKQNIARKIFYTHDVLVISTQTINARF